MGCTENSLRRDKQCACFWLVWKAFCHTTVHRVQYCRSCFPERFPLISLMLLSQDFQKDFKGSQAFCFRRPGLGCGVLSSGRGASRNEALEIPISYQGQEETAELGLRYYTESWRDSEAFPVHISRVLYDYRAICYERGLQMQWGKIIPISVISQALT